MSLLKAKLTADKIIGVHITRRLCPLPLCRLSSRGDFLVRLRLSNLRPGWQRVKSAWADWEPGRQNSVTCSRRKRGWSHTSQTPNLAAELWSAPSPGTWGRGHPQKPTPRANIHPSTHTALLSIDSSLCSAPQQPKTKMLLLWETCTSYRL